MIRFAVNSAFVWGGLLGSLKCGAFYIFPTIHTRAVAGEAGRPPGFKGEHGKRCLITSDQRSTGAQGSWAHESRCPA